MTEIDLSEKFPDLRPIQSNPSLYSLNGIGLTVYGERDLDDETGTYIKTHCVCILFIPVFALGAYRVADAHQGWYFLGKERLSALAKIWNLVLIGAIGLGITYASLAARWNSPTYLAGRRIAQMDKLVEEGEFLKALREYREFATNAAPEFRLKAKERIKAILNQASAEAKADELTEIWRLAGQLADHEVIALPQEELVELIVSSAKRQTSENPRVAVECLNLAGQIAPLTAEVTALRESLLTKLVAAAPQDVELAAQLAAMLVASKREDEADKLLLPLRDKLGTGEGSRVLGQLLSRKGKLDESYELLSAYCDEHLKTLHQAEADFASAFRRERDSILTRFRNEQGPRQMYRELERPNPDQKRQAIVTRYLDLELKKSTKIQAAQDKARRASRVVPVALELGMVTLQRARKMTDPAKKKAALRRAEKTFLAVRGSAGESSQFQLVLGQVYYWLGRHDEGKKLFDNVLKTSNRNFEVLLQVAGIAREVGNRSESQKLVEEAYNSAAKVSDKHMAAMQRSLMPNDLDDQITWLNRSGTAIPNVKAALSEAKGQVALRDLKTEEAIRHFQDAIKTLNGMPGTVANHNNGALVHFHLFRANGDRKTFDRGVELMEKAIAENPGDPIVLSNAAHFILDGAVRGMLNKHLDLHTLRATGRLDFVRFLYDSAEQRQKYVAELEGDPVVAKVEEYFHKVILLAPKNPTAPAQLSGIYFFTQNTGKLTAVAEAVKDTQFDLVEQNKQLMDFYSGKDDDKRKRDAEATLERTRLAFQATETDSDLTAAAARDQFVIAQMNMRLYRAKIDYNELVKIAETNVKDAPSRQTRSTLIDVLLARGTQTEREKNGAFSKVYEKFQRSLEVPELIACLLYDEHSPAAAAELRSNSDIQRASKLLEERRKSYPDDSTAWEWALLSGMKSPHADAALTALKKSKGTIMTYRLGHQISALSAAVVVRMYWTEQANNNAKRANEIVAQARKAGVPLPLGK